MDKNKTAFKQAVNSIGKGNASPNTKIDQSEAYTSPAEAALRELALSQSQLNDFVQRLENRLSHVLRDPNCDEAGCCSGVGECPTPNQSQLVRALGQLTFNSQSISNKLSDIIDRLDV